ncbi:GatB/YqeY domain-containing protein, partial [Candidatus Pacearchaeota archaeon]|nr:GatB/YqeY domain-containing protein [Candidatus Pacearchaeota archaeon]
MPLLNKIKNDLYNARKASDRVALTILTTLYAEAAMKGKNSGNRESTDEEVTATITKFVKNAKELLSHIEDIETKDKITSEISVYEAYLPSQMSKEELTSVITNIMEIKEGDIIPNIGMVMKHLSANYNGMYDGKLASE